MTDPLPKQDRMYLKCELACFHRAIPLADILFIGAEKEALDRALHEASHLEVSYPYGEDGIEEDEREDLGGAYDDYIARAYEDYKSWKRQDTQARHHEEEQGTAIPLEEEELIKALADVESKPLETDMVAINEAVGKGAVTQVVKRALAWKKFVEVVKRRTKKNSGE